MTGFPDGFLWGASTAAYQIEGAVAEGGRTPSVWDTFAHTPGLVAGGDTGDVATDHYHRWQEDLDHIARLGMNAYRFSISWPRVLPGGGDRLNPEGVDFYSRLVDGLLERGVAPVVTLYHWDLPQELEDAGGWPVRETALRFSDYAERVGRVLGDRVHTWTTLNEPWCVAYLGYSSAEHAPGRREDPAAVLAAAHHLNLGHGLAARALRSVVSPRAQVSVTLNLHHTRPDDPANPDDVDAARQVDAAANRIFLGPMLDGAYPPDLIADQSRHTDWSFVRDGDVEAARAPMDVLGINYYSGKLARRVSGRRPGPAGDGYVGGPGTTWFGCQDVLLVRHSGPSTEMGWAIEPDGLEELLLRMHRDHPALPLMVTESGAAFDDRVETGPGGEPVVHDERRVRYLADHVEAVRRAIGAGADVRGYMVWSLVDNFEWAHGLSKRFGLIRVDYATQRRVWKDSAHWYRELIAKETGAAGR